VTSPPSQAVIEAVEQVMCRLVHGEDWTVPAALPDSSEPRHRVAACYSCQRNAVEVARAAEAAALRAAAERMDDLSRGIPLAAAITARAAAIRLDHWADELTDTDDRSKP